MGKDSAAWIELGSSFHQMRTVNKNINIYIHWPKYKPNTFGYAPIFHELN